jgi:hypothetical protein
MENRAGKNILIAAGRLLCLVAGIALSTDSNQATAGQSSTLGVGVSVARSCRFNTIDIVSTATKAGIPSGASPVVQCGKDFPHVVSITSPRPSIQPSRADTFTQGDLTVTLSF